MDCEGPSVYSIDHPIAKVNHMCCECRQAILPGQRYEKFKGCWDGKWDRFTTCMLCAELRDMINNLHRNDDCGGIPFGSLGEWAREDGYEFPVKEDD